MYIIGNLNMGPEEWYGIIVILQVVKIIWQILKERKYMRLTNKLLSVVGAAILLNGTALFAATSTEATSIIEKAFAYVGSLNQYAFEAVVQNDDITDDKMVKYRHDVHVKVKRPDKFRIETKGDVKNRSIYFNDGLFTMLDHDFNYYGQIKTPKTIDKALDYIFDKYGIEAPLAQLIYSDMHKRTKMKLSKYFGKVDLYGTECDYVAFADSKKEVHIWITRGEKPLIRNFVIIDKTGKEPLRSDASVSWDLQKKLPDSDFVFKAPNNAMKISVESAR